MSFKKDKSSFSIAYSALERLSPGYLPFRNIILKWIFKSMGYRAAAYPAFWYRKIISIFSRRNNEI
jgi:hypothetical protein